MTTPFRLAINGYGRIGRCVLRALHESALGSRFRVVAINEPADLDSMAYLTRFDSTHGIFPGVVEQGDNSLIINGRHIAVTHAATPEALAWDELGIDLLIECSGRYSTQEQLQRFLDAGCPRLLLSHPGASAADVQATVVYGVNHDQLQGTERLVSSASCTTNAAVPVLALLNRAFGLEHVFLTTLHSVMNDQPLIDGYHNSDLRRTRSAMQSFVPVSTGLARGVERLLPELSGKIQAKAIRVPTLNVSAIDLMFQARSELSVDAVNALMRQAAQDARGLIDYSELAHASVDFNHNPHSVVIDASQTRLCGPHMANMLIWFDNEWGFTNRLLDVADFWRQRLQQA